VPDNLVWLEVEPTWRELIAGRLSTTSRIRSFTVLIHLDQAYGLSSEIAGKARKHKIGLGGEVSGATARVADDRRVPGLTLCCEPGGGAARLRSVIFVATARSVSLWTRCALVDARGTTGRRAREPAVVGTKKSAGL
jgi:hypothetical protein